MSGRRDSLADFASFAGAGRLPGYWGRFGDADTVHVLLRSESFGWITACAADIDGLPDGTPPRRTARVLELVTCTACRSADGRAAIVDELTRLEVERRRSDEVLVLAFLGWLRTDADATLADHAGDSRLHALPSTGDGALVRRWMESRQEP